MFTSSHKVSQKSLNEPQVAQRCDSSDGRDPEVTGGAIRQLRSEGALDNLKRPKQDGQVWVPLWSRAAPCTASNPARLPPAWTPSVLSALGHTYVKVAAARREAPVTKQRVPPLHAGSLRDNAALTRPSSPPCSAGSLCALHSPALGTV